MSSPSKLSVTVAVVDSGVDISHPDLANHIWENQRWRADRTGDSACPGDRYGCAFVSPETEHASCGHQSSAPSGAIADDNGHGTFVAGVVASTARAVDNNVDVRILPVKVLDCTGEGRASHAAAGVRYAARAGARVIVLPFSGVSDVPVLKDAVSEAREVYGALVIAAVGNDGTTERQFPSGYPGVMGVGGTGVPRVDREVDYLRIAPFSNMSEAVSLLAPAVEIMGPVPPTLCGRHDWLCVDGTAYAYASGTSYAAPLVAGAAAALFAQYPDLTPDDAFRLLTETAHPIPGSAAGQINIAAALARAAEMTGPAMSQHGM